MLQHFYFNIKIHVLKWGYMKNKILHTIYKTFPALIILVFPVAGIKDVKKSIVFKVIVNVLALYWKYMFFVIENLKYQIYT